MPRDRTWVTEEDWARHRETISRLYADEGQTLSDVMSTMEKEYGFHATVKMYKSRFKRWGLWKYTKAEDVTEIMLQKPQLSGDPLETAYVVVNGRCVELRRVDAYIKRRRLRVNARLQEHLRKSSSLQTDLPGVTLPGASPHQPSPGAFKSEEYTYRAIRDYFDNRLAANRWVFQSTKGIDMQTPDGMEGTRQWNEFYERFRVAILLVDQGTPERATEGVKMIRICFAEVATVLRHEDPGILFAIFSLLRLLRSADSRLASVPRQLLCQFSALATAMNHPTVHILTALLQILDEGVLDNYRSLRSMEVIADQMARWLGPQHAKTTEMWVLSWGFDDTDQDNKTAKLQRIIAELDEDAPFDARHAAARMNLSSLYLGYGKLDMAAELILATLCDPDKKRVTRGRPTIMYKILRSMGRICYLQKRYDEAKIYFLRGVEIGRELTKNWGTAGLLDCLVWFETCLRAQGNAEEADKVVRERQKIVRDTLKSVGEGESSVETLQSG